MTFGNPLSLRVDGAIGAMSLSPAGRDAVLAGRRGLFVIDLDDPFSPPRWLHHITSWEVADVQWSPHSSRPAWVVSTSNQKAMVWNLARSSDNAIEHVLHRHTRAITDINFHPENADILATCSVDSFIYAWDLRQPRKPAYGYADWRAGATQVKWNYKDPNVMASSHDNYFYVWDIRKGAVPVHKVVAHNGKINGLDFSKDHANRIISCSNDFTVKLWDLGVSTTEAQSTILTDFPVARARQLPFDENGCGIMPLRGGDDSIYIADFAGTGESKLAPKYVFKGHTEPIKDFLWRRGIDSHIYKHQLVTWSKDCDLRLWPEETQLDTQTKNEKASVFNYNTYHEEPNIVGVKTTAKRDSFVSSSRPSTKLNHLDWISGVRIGRSAFAPPIAEDSPYITGNFENSPANLGEELSIVGHKFPKIKFEKISVSTGHLVLSLNGSVDEDRVIFIRTEINFPQSYPAEAPRFTIERSHELNSETRDEMLRNLDEVAAAFTNKQKYCLEPCLRTLMGEKINLEFEMLEDEVVDPYELPAEYEDDEDGFLIDSDSDDGDLVPINTSVPRTLMSGFDSTPVPKGCGAVWTPTGHLVCFFEPKEETKTQFNGTGFNLKKPNFGKISLEETSAPDSDSDLSDDSFTNDWDQILQHDIPSRARVPGLFKGTAGLKNYGRARLTHNISLPTERSGTMASNKTRPNRNVVSIHDYRDLIPAKRELACEYRVLGDSPEKLVQHNAEIALKYGYKDIADCWKILEMVLIKDVEIGSGEIDFLYQSEMTRAFRSPEANFRFYWGAHPFGNRWLVSELIHYFERMGNIQMLAMLSCILYENIEASNNPNVPIHTPYQPIPSPLIPSDRVYSDGSYTPSVTFPKRDQMGRYSVNGSISSSLEGSLKSASPERHSFLRKGIQQTFYESNSHVSTTSLTKNNEEFHKRNLHSRNSSYYPNIDSKLGVIPSLPFSGGQIRAPPEVRIQIQNEGTLDLYDDVYSMPLLNPEVEYRLKLYREEYADLLYYWGLPVNRIKILKFNFPNVSSLGSSLFKIHNALIGERMETNGGAPPKDCGYCGLKVKKRFVICGVCEHILHASCATEWWKEGEECPNGCGCHCLEATVF